VLIHRLRCALPGRYAAAERCGAQSEFRSAAQARGRGGGLTATSMRTTALPSPPRPPRPLKAGRPAPSGWRRRLYARPRCVLFTNNIKGALTPLSPQAQQANVHLYTRHPHSPFPPGSTSQRPSIHYAPPRVLCSSSKSCVKTHGRFAPSLCSKSVAWAALWSSSCASRISNVRTI
jgi:hypothetical protein